MTKQESNPASHMLIGRDRLFYNGLLGNSMRERRMGCIAVYVASGEDFSISIGDKALQKRRIVALAPFTTHRLQSPDGYILNLCIEPESVDPVEIGAFIAEVNARPDGGPIKNCVSRARDRVARGEAMDGFSSSEFDQFFLGRTLGGRRVDPRIAHALDLLTDHPSDLDLSAGQCADDVGLSVSRFLHLFKENTHIPFRSKRMWRRARRFMDYATVDSSLTEVALDLGYPDSSHFSHSIRSSFGLQPRSIQRGSRGMKVSVGSGYELSASFA